MERILEEDTLKDGKLDFSEKDRIEYGKITHRRS